MKYKFYKRNIQILLVLMILIAIVSLICSRKTSVQSISKKEVTGATFVDSAGIANKVSKVDDSVNINKKRDSIQEKILVQQGALKKKLALIKMKTKYDDIENITWYSDKSTPQSNNINNLNVYFGLSGKSTDIGGNPWLRFVIQYAGENWLFINNYSFKIDDNVYSLKPKFGEVKRDNNERVWEWYDTVVDKNIYNIIYNLIMSKNAKVRYDGKQYYNDRTITSKEKQAIKNVLEAFEVLGGTTNF
ncbi:MAG: hypothetical protein IPP04_02940 [Saprospiraceae bacterium]|nr:hypothetical protein [Saprospiraceae bacterium]